MKLYQVDAFTSEKFSGNPAGVVIVEAFPKTSLMTDIASEMNLSETAFLKHIDSTNYEIRFFTPTEEVPLCGHATLASSHILFSTGRVGEDETIYFSAQGGNLDIVKNTNGYSMDFPLWDFSHIDDLVEAQRFTGIQDIREVSDTDKKWKIILIDSLEVLKNLEPNFSIMKGSEYGNIVVTCKGDDKYDYYMRCFVTDCGINEDPVTGSIECVLAPYWSEKLGKSKLSCFQCSERGGEKKVELFDNRIRLFGEAITVFETDLNI